MTEENYQYRTSQNMLRNQFEGEGIFQTPIIPKSSFSDEEFESLLLIGFDRTRADDEKNRDRMVHFFLYDYKFERVWKDAEKGLRVIPTVSWGNENTFELCFLGIPKGSTVAVSTYMVSEHDNRCNQKTQAEGFILGVAAKMFTIAGPVIVYGLSALVVYGLYIGFAGWCAKKSPRFKRGLSS